MEPTDIQNKKAKEKYSDFEDFQDYKSSQSVKKFFTIKGFIKAIVIVFVFIILYIIGAYLIDYLLTFISIIPSFLIILSGIGIYFFDRSLKKKTNLLIKKTSDYIKLSSPLFIDILSFFSVPIILLGIFLVLFNTYLIYESVAGFYFGCICYIFTIMYCFTLYKRYRHSLFDKIVIFKDYILFDHPETKETIRINKEETSKIVDLWLLKSGILDKRIIEFHYLNDHNGKTIEIEDEHLENMRLNIDLFFDSLKEMDYTIAKEYFTFGQTNHTDENGKQIVI